MAMKIYHILLKRTRCPRPRTWRKKGTPSSHAPTSSSPHAPRRSRPEHACQCSWAWGGLGWAGLCTVRGASGGRRRLSRAAVVCAHAVHMPHLHRAATVVLAVEQHRLSCRSAGLKGEEAGTCACSVEPVYFQPLSKARNRCRRQPTMPWARPGGATTASYRNLGGSGAAAEGVKGVSRAAGGRQKEAERGEPRWRCTSRHAGCALEAPGIGVRQPVRANDGAALGKGCLNRGVVDRKRKVRHVDAHLLVPSRCRGRHAIRRNAGESCDAHPIQGNGLFCAPCAKSGIAAFTE